MMTASAWAYDLRGITPLAKLLAIAIANDFREEGAQDVSLDYLLRFTDAELAAINDAFWELRQIGVTCELDDDSVIVDLPLPPRSGPILSGPQPKLWIYVVVTPAATKVGITRDLEQRFRSLQWGIPERLRLEWSASGPRGPICMIETAVHDFLSDHQISGEWFNVSPRTAIEAIKAQFAKHGMQAPK